MVITLAEKSNIPTDDNLTHFSPEYDGNGIKVFLEYKHYKSKFII